MRQSNRSKGGISIAKEEFKQNKEFSSYEESANKIELRFLEDILKNKKEKNFDILAEYGKKDELENFLKEKNLSIGKNYDFINSVILNVNFSEFLDLLKNDNIKKIFDPEAKFKISDKNGLY